MTLPIQVFLVWIMGLVIIYFGYLIFTRKVPTLLDYFLKLGVTFTDKNANRFFGGLIMVVGIVVLVLPFILGIENMNL